MVFLLDVILTFYDRPLYRTWRGWLLAKLVGLVVMGSLFWVAVLLFGS